MRLTRLLMAAAGAMLLALPAQAQQNGELFLYSWSNYTPPDLLRKFEEETGIKVTLDVYDSNETLLAKLQAGASGYDVIVPSGYMVKIMAEDGLLEKIDAKKMENGGLMVAPHDEPFFDPDREYSAPYMWGTTGFSYDSERAPGGELPESWSALFEPAEELKGQIFMLNDEVEVYNAGAYYAGVSKCTEDPAEAQAILDILLAQKPFVAAYNSDGTIERMASGEVIAHHQWNGAAHRTKEQRESVVYVYPEEGVTFWDDNFAVPKGAPNLENAKTFINWMMKPENIAVASNFTGYMNAIKGATDHMDAALKDDPAVAMPEEYADRLRPSENCSEAARELRNRVWTRLKS